MEREEIVSAARELLTAGRPFLLATVDPEGRPHVRWMGGCVLDEPLTVWMATGADSRKMQQVRANSAAQLLYNDEKFGRIATVSGACEIVTDAEAKQRLWEAMPVLANYMCGPDDPSFGVIKFTGRHIELLNMAEGGMTPQVADL